jgi:hypothetical protein
MNDIVCIFCAKLAGDGAISDEAGEIACADCGAAEISAQQAEGFWTSVPKEVGGLDDRHG